MILFLAPPPPPPVFSGDPEADLRLGASLQGAMVATEAYGPWPQGRWELLLHQDAAGFERLTKAGLHRGACWVGNVLHLRPWEELKRRDLGAILRHELVHRRLSLARLRRWEEEARCLYSENHVRPPAHWPASPSRALQDRLDRALAGGTSGEQAWAYRMLRAWVAGAPLVVPPAKPPQPLETWHKEAMPLQAQIVVRWPVERLPEDLEINGQCLSRQPGNAFRFNGIVRFGAGAPIRSLRGTVTVSRKGRGWSLAWTTTPQAWIAAATAGELGDTAPLEARRALASVLKCWLDGHPRGNHPDGAFCPLTHCAVIRGMASEETDQAVRGAPRLVLDPGWAFFCSSKGGVSLSPQAVWGEGSSTCQEAVPVPNDRWQTWTRTFTAGQVRLLKRSVPHGLKVGQKGLMLGASGPYSVEALRLAAGRAFGWTSWPSNACEGELDDAGRLVLRGHGWGHNVGLCLATASWEATHGQRAEGILAAAFGKEALK